jgi:hypothetical protein
MLGEALDHCFVVGQLAWQGVTDGARSTPDPPLLQRNVKLDSYDVSTTAEEAAGGVVVTAGVALPGLQVPAPRPGPLPLPHRR